MVAVAAGDGAASAKLVESDGTVRTGKTEPDQVLWADAEFHGFAFLITAVVNSINQGLFDRSIGKIDDPDGGRQGKQLDFIQSLGLTRRTTRLPLSIPRNLCTLPLNQEGA